MNWTIEKNSDVCYTVRIKHKPRKDWSAWGLMGSDAHIDNPHTLLDLKRTHLDKAKEREAFIFEFGDTFDAMQGKTDRRSSKRDFPKFKAQSYLNDLVDFGADFFKPYKDNLAMISEGNHESSVDNKLEYNLIDGLVRDLGREGSPVIKGGYRGWIRFMFEAEGGGQRQSFKAYFHHGAGGGGPVTRGVIGTNRRAVYLKDCDMVFTGHTHEQWIVPVTQVGITDLGKEYSRKQYHVQLPTYKEEFVGHAGGWHHETGKPPKPLGAAWIKFYYDCKAKRIKFKVEEAEV